MFALLAIPALAAPAASGSGHMERQARDAGPQNIVVEDAWDVGAYGGTCTCPDGNVYQVGDNRDSCGSLACIGGTPGVCHSESGPWQYRQVTCMAASGPQNLVVENADRVGYYGGTCTCPNGQVYNVGDNHDDCRSLACLGGTSGNACHEDDGPWAYRRVTCAAAAGPQNIVQENAEGTGQWGGTCTCPNGQSYPVGDNDDACKSLACINGVSGKCHSENKNEWKYRRVICATLPEPIVDAADDVEDEVESKTESKTERAFERLAREAERISRAKRAYNWAFLDEERVARGYGSPQWR